MQCERNMTNSWFQLFVLFSDEDEVVDSDQCYWDVKGRYDHVENFCPDDHVSTFHLLSPMEPLRWTQFLMFIIFQFIFQIVHHILQVIAGMCADPHKMKCGNLNDIARALWCCKSRNIPRPANYEVPLSFQSIFPKLIKTSSPKQVHECVSFFQTSDDSFILHEDQRQR